MINSLIIDGHDLLAEYGLHIKSRSVPLPKPRTKFVEIPGGNGSLDLSTALTGGEMRFDDRVLSVVLTGTASTNYNTARDQIAQLLHGRAVKLVFSDDPGHYFLGRAWIDAWNYDDAEVGEYTIAAQVRPWRFLSDGTAAQFLAFPGGWSETARNLSQRPGCASLGGVGVGYAVPGAGASGTHSINETAAWSRSGNAVKHVWASVPIFADASMGVNGIQAILKAANRRVTVVCKMLAGGGASVAKGTAGIDSATGVSVESYGYTDLAGGIVLCWATLNVTNASAVTASRVTFPVAMPNVNGFAEVSEVDIYAGARQPERDWFSGNTAASTGKRYRWLGLVKMSESVQESKITVTNHRMPVSPTITAESAVKAILDGHDFAVPAGQPTVLNGAVLHEGVNEVGFSPISGPTSWPSLLQRENFAVNPGCTENSSWWAHVVGTGGLATGARAALSGFSTPHGYEATWTKAPTSFASAVGIYNIVIDGNVVPGTVMSFAAEVQWSIAQKLDCFIQFVNSGNGLVSTSTHITDNVVAGEVKALKWEAVTVPAGAAGAVFHLYVSATGGTLPPVGAKLRATALQAEKGSTIGPYFDGSSAPPDAMHYHTWSGAVGAANSSSRLFEYQSVPVTVAYREGEL